MRGGILSQLQRLNILDTVFKTSILLISGAEGVSALPLQLVPLINVPVVNEGQANSLPPKQERFILINSYTLSAHKPFTHASEITNDGFITKEELLHLFRVERNTSAAAFTEDMISQFCVKFLVVKKKMNISDMSGKRQVLGEKVVDYVTRFKDRALDYLNVSNEKKIVRMCIKGMMDSMEHRRICDLHAPRAQR
ncbi:hypothetical protein FNV43_RR24737 [Rhamnella rubrinervis]|uniref:Uncharacterized protein n=1 Tax=Rhamnella rubrinervis TaxID=2594499 RepID=A0A8K0DSV4_9ROSA|nr:hypothetical protein FNV43_RR24737 [Rhamnella rubrinervis]